MIPVYIARYDISVLSCLRVPYAIYSKSTQIHPGFYIYTHERSICLIASIINNIRYTPQGLTGLCPSVRFIRTCVEYTESYYDKHTNTTEIRPDYYIYTLERSICLIVSIINNIRYTPQGLTGLCPLSLVYSYLC